jgi:DNA-binding response OmpR family regulator
VEVLECLAADPPPLVVLDLMMPRVNGFDVLRWLRENDPELCTSVIVLSAFTIEAGGFDRYPHVVEVMQKPLYIDRLLAAVERCVAHQSLAA